MRRETQVPQSSVVPRCKSGRLSIARAEAVIGNAKLGPSAGGGGSLLAFAIHLPFPGLRLTRERVPALVPIRTHAQLHLADRHGQEEGRHDPCLDAAAPFQE